MFFRIGSSLISNDCPYTLTITLSFNDSFRPERLKILPGTFGRGTMFDIREGQGPPLQRTIENLPVGEELAPPAFCETALKPTEAVASGSTAQVDSFLIVTEFNGETERFPPWRLSKLRCRNVRNEETARKWRFYGIFEGM